MLETKIIEKFDFSYAFPIIFARKKNTSSKTNPTVNIQYQMAIDCRLLKNFLESNPYPIPNIK